MMQAQAPSTTADGEVKAKAKKEKKPEAEEVAPYVNTTPEGQKKGDSDR